MPPRYLTFLFVGLDIASFCIQLLGASKSGSVYTEEKMSTTDRQYTAKGGMDILRLGLVLQTIGVVVFSIISTRFIFISHRWHGRRSRYGVSNATWAVLVYVATIAMAVVMVFYFRTSLPSDHAHAFTGPNIVPNCRVLKPA